jgi:hypothetical protein
MRNHIHGIILLLGIVTSESRSASAVTPGDPPLKTTMCELFANPSRFAGRDVEVRATFTGNFEMSVLNDRSCPRSDVVIWYGNGLIGTEDAQYAFLDSLDALKIPETIHWQSWVPNTFHDSKESIRMFKYVRKHQKKRDATVEASFVGRFDFIPISKWLALKTADGKTIAVSAFGHQNCCNARLVPKSVSAVKLPTK